MPRPCKLSLQSGSVAGTGRIERTVFGQYALCALNGIPLEGGGAVNTGLRLVPARILACRAGVLFFGAIRTVLLRHRVLRVHIIAPPRNTAKIGPKKAEKVGCFDAGPRVLRKK